MRESFVLLDYFDEVAKTDFNFLGKYVLVTTLPTYRKYYSSDHRGFNIIMAERKENSCVFPLT